MDAINSEVVYTKLTEMEARLQARIDRVMDEVKQLVRDMGRDIAEMRSATPSRREHEDVVQQLFQLRSDMETHKKEGHADTNTRVSNLEAVGPRKFTVTTTMFFILFGAISTINTLLNLYFLMHR